MFDFKNPCCRAIHLPRTESSRSERPRLNQAFSNSGECSTSVRLLLLFFLSIGSETNESTCNTETNIDDKMELDLLQSFIYRLILL